MKLSSPYGGSSYLNISIDRRDVSSEEEEPTEKEGDNPFDQAIQGVLFRRITIKNLSADSLLMVATLKTVDPQPNFTPSNF